MRFGSSHERLERGILAESVSRRDVLDAVLDAHGVAEAGRKRRRVVQLATPHGLGHELDRLVSGTSRGFPKYSTLFALYGVRNIYRRTGTRYRKCGYASLTTTWPAPHSRLFTHCTKIAQHSRLKTDQILSTPSSFLSTCRLNQRGDEARS
jgi:hypothetical protein